MVTDAIPPQARLPDSKSLPARLSIEPLALRWRVIAPRLNFPRPSHSGGQYNRLYPKCRNALRQGGAHSLALRMQSSALSDPAIGGRGGGPPRPDHADRGLRPRSTTASARSAKEGALPP